MYGNRARKPVTISVGEQLANKKRLAHSSNHSAETSMHDNMACILVVVKVKAAIASIVKVKMLDVKILFERILNEMLSCKIKLYRDYF